MARSAKKIEYAPAEQIGVIYARYSSHNQKEESIEQQIAECTEFAEKNGIRIIGIYADKAVSGRSDRRPNFQRMMRDAEKRHFQIVVAYKSNRIARNMLNALQYEAKLDSFGIKTLYAKEEFGNTAAGRFALRTMMNVNQFYSENMGEDIKRGMVDNATECKVNGMLPLGYVKGEDGKYAIAADEAAVLREIYDSVLKDIPLAEIARSLNQRGIRTKLGRDWNKNSFHILLKNDNYIGVYRHSGVVVEDGIPPILDKEVFEAVQEKLTNKKKTAGRRSANGEYLLTGKLFHIQIVKGEEYQAKAISQQTRDITISAKRGTIYDRNYKALAISATEPCIITTNARSVTQRADVRRRTCAATSLKS